MRLAQECTRLLQVGPNNTPRIPSWAHAHLVRQPSHMVCRPQPRQLCCGRTGVRRVSTVCTCASSTMSVASQRTAPTLAQVYRTA